MKKDRPTKDMPEQSAKVGILMIINELGNVYGNANSCIEYLIKSFNTDANDVLQPEAESTPDYKSQFRNLGSIEN